MDVVDKGIKDIGVVAITIRDLVDPNHNDRPSPLISFCSQPPPSSSTMRTNFLLTSSLLVAGAYAGNQQPLSGTNSSYLPYNVHNHEQGLFSPLESLSLLSEETYTTLKHPFFPKYQVRMKKSNFCDKNASGYTGYIDIAARHLFFYFFESRSSPSTDDIIFWTNGGPGCSSSLGLFMELGPCLVLDEEGPKENPWSWNNNANVFFVDQPIGVGFSYAEYGETVSTTEEAAKDIASFIAIFFEHFSQFKGRALHMAGESYGGRYIPLFAAEVYDQNAKLVEAGLTPINLVSAVIGNGITDPYAITASYYDMQCTSATLPPIVDISTCVRMKQILPRCEKWAKESCIDTYDAINCDAARSFCYNELIAPFFDTGINPYDISKPCDGTMSDTLCYPITRHINNFLDQPKTRKRLGVDSSLSNSNFTSCSDAVGSQFTSSLDMSRISTLHVSALLERNVKVLIYVGTYDWICNWIGNERWTLDLDWSGKGEFRKESLRVWEVDGERVGRVRSKRGLGLTYATVEGAGHMVPYDKPKEALVLIQKWMKGEEL